MNYKKAEGKELGYIIVLIILIASAVLMLLLLYQINRVSDEGLDIRICRKSVDLVSAARLEGLNSEGLKCPTSYIEIKTDNEEKIKKALAESMANCWYKFGEGRKEIFSRTFWKRDRNYCAICSVIKFDKKAKNKKISGFFDYLKDNNVKTAYCNENSIKKGVFHDCSYLGYLLPYSTKGNIGELYRKFSTDREKRHIAGIIDTENDYASVLIYSKHSNINKKESSLLGLYSGTGAALALVLFPEPVISKAAAGFLVLGGLAGSATGYILGNEKSSDWYAGVALVPYSSKSLESLNCEELPVNQQRKDTTAINKKKEVK